MVESITTSKPPLTIVNDLNYWDWQKFKEKRRFDTWKDKGHFYFDKIWRLGLMTRPEAYKWLSRILELTEEETHFSLFSPEQCQEAILECQRALNDNRRLDMDFGEEPKTPFYILEE